MTEMKANAIGYRNQGFLLCKYDFVRMNGLNMEQKRGVWYREEYKRS